MAIQSNFPAIKPSLLLDFANTKQLDSRITYTRASTATFYNGVTTAKAEENLVPRSQELNDTSVWSVQAVTVTANTSVAPDGTTTAETITASATSATHFLFFGSYPTVSLGIQLGCSVFAKAGTNNFFQLSVLNEANTYANFDLSTGTIGTTGSNVSSVTMTSVGSGWYRCSFVITSTTNAANSSLTFAPVASNSVGRLPTWTPAGTETVILWGAQLEQRSAVSAYTATTTQAITNYIPVLQSAASGVARFDNNPTTGESLGLLIEESRTNLILQSADFTTTWTTSNATVSANTVIAPDGTLTGDSIINTATSSQHYALQNVSIAANGTYTTSVYLKALGTTTIATIWLLNASTADRALVYFTFATGAVATSSAGGTPFTSVSATATSVGNGWSRVTLTATSTGGAINLQTRIFPNDSSTFTGDAYSGVFVWGAQVELGSFATSYIPTVASQVTRAADAASMTGTNFSSWYNGGESAIYGEFNLPALGGSQALLHLTDTAEANRVRIYAQLSGITRFTVTANGSILFNNDIASVTTGSSKVAIGIKSGSYGTVRNAGTVGTNSSIPTPNGPTELRIGRDASSGYLNGSIKKISVYPIRPTDTQLQALTS